MTALGYKNGFLTTELSEGKLAPCADEEICCCQWLRQFNLYAHFIPEAGGCADEADYIGDVNQLIWSPAGDCDGWTYVTPVAFLQLLQCPNYPGPAIDVGHYIWLRCNGDNEFTVDICLDQNGVPPTPTTSNCDDNLNGVLPEVQQLVCRSPTDPTQAGNLFLDFGLVEFSLCPESGCGWRLIITTLANEPDEDSCSVCFGETPETIDVEITGFSNDTCGTCTSLNGTWTLTKHPFFVPYSDICVWTYDYGSYCGQEWTLYVVFQMLTTTSYQIIWAITNSVVLTVASGQTVVTEIPDCADEFSIPDAEDDPDHPSWQCIKTNVRAVINPS